MTVTDDNYFDHDADIGIIGIGSSLEQSFENAAEAMFALMTDLSKIDLVVSFQFKFDESDQELAFVTWLNLLIAKAQADHLIFAQFEIYREGDLWNCTARGQVWHNLLERRIEVKGATLTMLSVKFIHDKWEAKCVVDV